jgi:hypothetical protein
VAVVLRKNWLKIRVVVAVPKKNITAA